MTKDKEMVAAEAKAEELKDEELEQVSGGKKTRHTTQEVASDPGSGITRAG